MCNENEHKLVHLETKKHEDPCGYHSNYKRIDIFYCDKCGEIITKEITKCQRDRPDWY